ncbi:MAG: YfiR family protein [Sedimentisphaerales bacterium]|jgi:hypothetical protein
MKIRAYIFIFVILALLAVQQVRGDSASTREYQVKAAFLYNFIMFVDWPPEKMPAADEPMIIGIIGKDPFENAFEPVKDKQVNGRKVVVKRFKGLEEIKKSAKPEMDKEFEEIRKCHLLFICSSEKGVSKEIAELVKDYSVLTVGDVPGFIESGGGMINFVLEEEKVRFEINKTNAEQCKLQIRSQLLRLAKRVIGEKLSQESKN